MNGWAESIIKKEITSFQTCLCPNYPPSGYGASGGDGIYREHRHALYTALLLSGKLNDHLSEIDVQAEDMFFQLVEQMAEKDGITEQLKANDQIRRIGLMNTCKAQVEESFLWN